MSAILAFMLRVMTGPIVGSILDIVKRHMDGKITEAEIRGEVEKALIRASQGAHSSQLDFLKAEIESDDVWVRRWRPCVAIAFAAVLLFYAIVVPILVNWCGFPPLRP